MIITIKIAVLSPYEEFARCAELIGSKFKNVKIGTFIGYFEEGIKLAKQAEAEGYDAIIARGITYKAAKKQVNIPVVNAQESLHDLIRALYKIRGHGYKVNLLLYEESNVISKYEEFIELLNTIFDIDLSVNVYTTSSEVEQLIIKSKGKFDVTIGGVYAMELCKKHHKEGVLWETGYDTIYLKIEECIRLVKVREKALLQRNQLRTILECAHDGIIYVDKKKVIRMANPMAIKILGISNELEVIGRPFESVINDQQISEVLKTGIGQNQEILTVGDDTKIVEDKIPVITNNKVEGVVVNFKEVTQVLQMEKKIRSELWKKGSVAKYNIDNIIGISDKIMAAKDLIRKFGKYDSNVLIYGETGTGKELFAQSIHNESKRRNEPFYAINCATLPENLLESELFGYSEGAFTGAKKGGKPGLFELAHNGTLFLDEIGDMPLSFQCKLLRALQEKEIRRIGGDRLISVNVRIIAASNKNLYEQMLDDRFREDLFYRINVMYIKIPPLRERREDIPYLINYFMDIYKEKLGVKISYKIDQAAMDLLTNYKWRGNVRELQNFVERIYIYINGKKTVTEMDVKELLHGLQESDQTLSKKDDEIFSHGTLDEITKIAIQEALERFDGNRTQAAKHLGVSRSFLWRKLNNSQVKGNFGQ